MHFRVTVQMTNSEDAADTRVWRHPSPAVDVARRVPLSPTPSKLVHSTSGCQGRDAWNAFTCITPLFPFPPFPSSLSGPFVDFSCPPGWDKATRAALPTPAGPCVTEAFGLRWRRNRGVLISILLSFRIQQLFSRLLPSYGVEKDDKGLLYRPQPGPAPP